MKFATVESLSGFESAVFSFVELKEAVEKDGGASTRTYLKRVWRGEYGQRTYFDQQRRYF